ncbi:MAG: hypothetical protein MI924_39520 [Chloroflexales bacterium]|nr:hypothetical protein [Chloroflexales bacterium]
MSDNSIARVHYFERQFLRTQDFTAEQQYHLAMRRRHNIAHHIWGVVAGLRLEVDKDNNLFVGSGMAIDGYGRELILAQKQPLSRAAFDEKDSDLLGVWLIYERISGDPAQAGYVGCGSNGAGSEYRWQELARPRLDTIDPNFPDMRRPKSVPDGDWNFDPSRTPPDDPKREWPVFLGQIRREPNPDQPGDYSYSVVQAEYNQPYAGLVGEAIVAPSGRAHLQIGAERPNDPRRFAVFIRDPESPQLLEPSPSLEIHKEGLITVHGATTVYGDLTMAGGGIEFGVGTASAKQARPWQIYHHVEQTSPDDSQTDAIPEALHQLRIEMALGAQRLSQVVVGAWSPDDQAFKPCLTVADNCQVTVHGNLVVQGVLTEGQARPKPEITSQARALALSATLSKISKTVSPTSNEEEIVRRMLDQEGSRQKIVNILVENQGRLRDFVNVLLSNETGRSVIINSLVTSAAGQAVISALLDSVAGQAIVINSLLTDSEKRQAVISSLLASATGRSAVVTSLLDSDVGRQAVIDGLLASDDALQTILKQLAANETSRNELTRGLLESNVGRQAVIAALLDTDTGRDAVVSHLSVDDAALRHVMRGLVADTGTRITVVDVQLETGETISYLIERLLDADEGLRAIAQELDDNDARISAFVAALKEFPDLATRLRDELAP